VRCHVNYEVRRIEFSGELRGESRDDDDARVKKKNKQKMILIILKVFFSRDVIRREKMK
jgi:hypothetical protein